MSQRPRVLLLIPHLGGGGAEAVIGLLARELARDKYDLHLGLVTQTWIPPAAVSEGLTVHPLGAPRMRSAVLSLLRLVRRIRPRIVLSGMFHLSFLAILLRPLFPRGVRILVRQNGTISSALAAGNVPAYTRLLYRVLYARADRIICQSSAMAEDLARELRIERSRLTVLPNPVDGEALRRLAAHGPTLWTGPGPNLVAIGRLAPEKGFDLLLEAIRIVQRDYPSINLAIAGGGPEEASLQAQCHRLGLEANVRFMGHLDQPAILFRGATAFVLSSRHEGMPNALLEAAVAGLPLVATPACGGVVDLLRGQPGTWLAGSISAPALAASLLEALQTLGPAERFAHAFIEPFRLECAIGAYEELLDSFLCAE